MSKKITIEEVKSKMMEDGNELLETEYKNNRTKMKYRCIKHNVVSLATWIHVKTGKYSCPICKRERISKAKTTSYEEAKLRIEKHGYKLISKTFIGTHYNVLMRCDVHGEFEQSLDCLDRGHGCQSCGLEKQIESQKLSIEFVREEFEKRNYILLENNYINCETPMRYTCPNHPERENYISYNNLKHGKGCLECHHDRISGENSYLWKGGVTNENKLYRSSSKYRTWRKNVFIRDEYTCQCCGHIGGILNAHHIENFSDNIDKRLDIKNGITLCKSCHHPTIEGSFHHIYGTKNNTLDQLNEYFTYKKSVLL